MEKPTLEEILAHPIVAALNPNTNNFLAVRWLTSRLNPFLETYGINVGAAVVVGGFPHIKVVAAFGMMMDDYLHGRYDGIDTLVVPSSGNTAHGVALLAPAFGIRLVKVVMSSDVPEAKKSVFSMIPHARLICPEGGRSVQEVAIEEANRSGSHLLDQYTHMANVDIHQACTGPQLLRAAGENLGFVAMSMGSTGTITGVSRYLKGVLPYVNVVGVQAEQSEPVPSVRNAAQIRAVVTIPWESAVDAIVRVKREESFLMARNLSTEVYPQVGPSGGAAGLGAIRYIESLEVRTSGTLEMFRGKRMVFVCADDGRFYPQPTASTLEPGQGLR